MKKATIISISLAMILASAPQPFSVSAAENEKSNDIVILYTNDVHCAVEDNIGYAGLALYKREMQALYDNVILVDAGDAIQGSPIGTATNGQAVITLMNQVGYDVCIPGNHDFDYNVETLLERNKELDCSYISSNIYSLENNERLFDPYKIVEAGDKKIAFVGITTPETFAKSTPVFFQDADGNYIYSFGEQSTQLYEYIQSGIDAARQENPDYVILLGHLGENDVTEKWSAQEVVAHFTDIDAFIDGHSHEETQLLEATDAEGKIVPITQTGSKLNNIGKIVISTDGHIDTELVSSVPEPDDSMELSKDSWVKLENGKYVDTAVKNAIDEINAKLDVTLNKKIGETTFKLYDSDPETGKRLVRNSETNIGNLCADAYRDVLDADIGIINGGGLRASIEVGDITYRDAMNIMPFGNMICSAKATGQQILDLLEAGVYNYPGEAGSFISVSGMTYMIDPDIKSSVVFNDVGELVEIAGKRRVHSVMVGEEPIDPEKTYIIASHDYYLKNGGDGGVLTKKCEIIRDSVMSESELLAIYIRDELDGVIPEKYRSPYGEGRIRTGKAPSESEEQNPPVVTTTTTGTNVTDITQTTTQQSTSDTVVTNNTTTTIPIDDLPQTGMSDVHKAVATVAVFTSIIGLGLVKKKRKEDED